MPSRRFTEPPYNADKFGVQNWTSFLRFPFTKTPTLMRTLLLPLLVCGLFTLTANAQEITARNGAKAEVVSGEIVIRFADKKGERPPAVGVAEKKDVAAGKRVQLTFEAQSTEATKARLVISDFAAPYTHLSETQPVTLGTTWQSYALNLKVKPTTGDKINLPLFVFEGFPTSGEVRVRQIKVGPVPVTAAAAPAVVAPTAAPKWKAIDTDDLYIKPGSALDFSAFFDPAPAGTYGRVIVNKQGELAFASKPDVAVRFFSVQLMPPAGFRLWEDKDVEEYAAAVARQGYNLVRFHFFDNLISGNWKAASLKTDKMNRYVLPEKPEEITFDALALDRFHLLLSELKKRGVYWNLDFMTSFVGFSNGQVREASKQGGYNTKAQMYVNPNFRANWKAATTRLLNDVNPYTKLPIKNDPALALTSCLNEQEILFESRNYGKEFDGVWQAFLAKKYGDYKKLREAWGGKCGTTELPENGSFADVPSIAAPTVLSDTPAGRDMARCCGDMELEMTQWYLATLRELGFTGLTSNYNMRSRIGTVPARALYPVITMNAYYAHPKFATGTDVAGTTVSQGSALSEGGASFKKQVASRFLDRPFVNTEFGHVFWNPYRHEQGLMNGAGAALQGWSGITCHAAQVVDSASRLTWFHAGDDPVIRAAEVVEALTFRRGDVAASTHTIDIPLTDDFIFAGRGMKALDDELTRLWVLCRVGITYGPKQANLPADLTVPPGKTSSIGGTLWTSEVAQSKTTGLLTNIVTKLRERKVLPASNASDPAAGILQSDTGEVTLNTTTGGELFVRTPRLEGVVIKSDKKVKLETMTIDRSTVPASITLASIDGRKPVGEANRLLLVISTDARNTDMKFADAKEEKIVDLGKLPILSRTGEFAVTLARAATPKKATAYALKLNGERGDEVPVKIAGNTLALSVDTEKLPKAGPTPFFEIVVE
ncbi:MAG: hypothetical protein B9S32_13010 [Verrucomicrobia bacterium Tous-C9LFEB]|nr:MAG: hypothetical protein B9S32_13010 [Verrucomicrobia bacterium Tous-C9LFEB]